MKRVLALSLSITLATLSGTGVALAAPPGPDLGQKAAPAGPAKKSAPAASPAKPCALARSVLGQKGLLDPQITVLPSADSFGAANRGLKLVVACGVSSDEVYTYSRILAQSGIGLLVFKGDETPDRVLEQLTERLGLAVPLAGASTPNRNPTSPAPGPATATKNTAIAAKNAVAAPSAAVTAKPSAAVTAKPAAAAVKPAAAVAKPSAAGAPNTPGIGPRAAGIRDIYLLAKAHDPDLGRTRARVLASQADSDVVRAGFHPHVDAIVGVSQINQTVYNYPPTTTHASMFGYNYDVAARIPLLHLPNYYSLSSAKATIRGEEAGATAAVQGLIVKLSDAYFSILRAKTDEQIARDELDRLKQVLEQAQAFLKAGTGDIISVYEAQARLDGVIADLNRAESGRRLAEQKLYSIVGQPVEVADFLHLQPTEPEPDDLNWWLDTMEKRDPQIQQAREGLTQTIEQTKAARAEHYPVIDATAGYDVSRGADFLPEVETHQWHVGATLSVALYSGGETAARVQRAVANQDERKYVLDATVEQRRENLKQSFFNLRYNVSLIKALKQKEVSLEIQLNAVRKGRSLGTRTAIDLLNAEQAYSMGRRDLRNALYDNVVRIIQLKAAAGILDEGDVGDLSWQEKCDASSARHCP